MADAITAEDLMRRQEALTARMQELVQATAGGGQEAGDRALAMAAQIQREAQELEAMARQFEAQHARSEVPRGHVQVALTPRQRQRVRDEVGVDMEVLQIPDSAGSMNQAMPVMTPQAIELMALAEARRRKQAQETGGQAEAQLGAAVAELERYPHVKQKLDELREDPNYLGGLLRKRPG